MLHRLILQEVGSKIIKNRCKCEQSAKLVFRPKIKCEIEKEYMSKKIVQQIPKEKIHVKKIVSFVIKKSITNMGYPFIKKT